MIDIYAYKQLNQEHIFLRDNHASDFFLTCLKVVFFYCRNEQFKKICLFRRKN